MSATPVAASSFPIPAYVLMKLPTLSPSATKLYLLLAIIATPTGQVSNPCAHLAKTSGLSERQIFRCLTELQSAGLLLRLPRPRRTLPLQLVLLSPQVVLTPMSLQRPHSVMTPVSPNKTSNSHLTPAATHTSTPNPASLVMSPMSQQQTLTYISQLSQQIKQFLTDPLPYTPSPIPTHPPNAL